MNEVFFFLKQGWNNIWKQWMVWVFIALPIFFQSFLTFETGQQSDLPVALISLVGNSIYLLLTLISAIGAPYLAYSFSIGKPATVRETLSAVHKFSGRAIGCSCFVALILVPCLYLVAILSRHPSLQPFQSSTQFIIILLLFSFFGAMIEFPLFEFFAKDVGLRESLRESWRLLTAHFYPLATLGLILTFISRLIAVASGMLTVLIQSGFDTASL